MGMGDGGAGLATVVDDDLAVTKPRRALVFLHPIADGSHHERELVVGQGGEAAIVLRGEDEDLVDPAGGRLGEDRAPVLHHEGCVALEGRVAVRYHAHHPAPGLPVDLEGWQRVTFVARAERAGRASSASGVGWRGRKSPGRCAWSVDTVIHRLDSGSRRSWFTLACIPPLSRSSSRRSRHQAIATAPGRSASSAGNQPAKLRPCERSFLRSPPHRSYRGRRRRLRGTCGRRLGGGDRPRLTGPGGGRGCEAFLQAGPQLAGRAIFLVPLLGLALLFGGDRDAAHTPWPWIGLAIWVVVAGLASGLCWPARHGLSKSCGIVRLRPGRGAPRPVPGGLPADGDGGVGDLGVLRRRRPRHDPAAVAPPTGRETPSIRFSCRDPGSRSAAPSRPDERRLQGSGAGRHRRTSRQPPPCRHEDAGHPPPSGRGPARHARRRGRHRGCLQRRHRGDVEAEEGDDHDRRRLFHDRLDDRVDSAADDHDDVARLVRRRDPHLRLGGEGAGCHPCGADRGPAPGTHPHDRGPVPDRGGCDGQGERERSAGDGRRPIPGHRVRPWL